MHRTQIVIFLLPQNNSPNGLAFIEAILLFENEDKSCRNSIANKVANLGHEYCNRLIAKVGNLLSVN